MIKVRMTRSTKYNGSVSVAIDASVGTLPFLFVFPLFKFLRKACAIRYAVF